MIRWFIRNRTKSDILFVKRGRFGLARRKPISDPINRLSMLADELRVSTGMRGQEHMLNVSDIADMRRIGQERGGFDANA